MNIEVLLKERKEQLEIAENLLKLVPEGISDEQRNKLEETLCSAREELANVEQLYNWINGMTPESKKELLDNEKYKDRFQDRNGNKRKVGDELLSIKVTLTETGFGVKVDANNITSREVASVMDDINKDIYNKLIKGE